MSSERYIPEHRRTQFKAKNTFKPDELRRRREEQQVEIRKAKREENLAKRRGITGRDGTQSSAPGASLGASIDSDDEGGTIESQVRYGYALCRSHMVILTAGIASFVVFFLLDRFINCHGSGSQFGLLLQISSRISHCMLHQIESV